MQNKTLKNIIMRIAVPITAVMCVFGAGVTGGIMPEAFGTAVYAAEYEDGFEYEIAGNGSVTVTKYLGSGGKVEIPSVLGGKRVTAIGEKAFYSCEGLTDIVIPDTVTTVGDYAFWYCTSLTAADIPASVKNIGYYAFFNCRKLGKLTLHEGLESIGGWAFSGCSALKDIKLPESAAVLGTGAFDNTSWYGSQPAGDVYIGKIYYRLKDSPLGGDITVKDGTKAVADGAFSNCAEVTGVELPKGITRIGNSTFFGVREMKSITLPEGITVIGAKAFCQCAGLEKLVLPDGVADIQDGALSYCDNFKELTMTRSVKRIGSGVFEKTLLLDVLYFVGTEDDFNKIEMDASTRSLLRTIIRYISPDDYRPGEVPEISSVSDRPGGSLVPGISDFDLMVMIAVGGGAVVLLIIVIRIIIAVRRKKQPKPRKSNPEPQMPKWRGTAPDSEDKQDAPEKDEDSGKL